MTIDIVFLVTAAFSVAGVIEYVKGFAPKAPTWVWQALLPVACVGVVLVAGQQLYSAVVVLALSQLCYQSIIQAVKKKIDSI
jgi:hypothetical protein